jgi:predicted DNA-binding antitoxin AbrB/MazE fold protein
MLEVMSQLIYAIYEDGVLKPLEPLSLAERQRVRVTIASEPSNLEDITAIQKRAMDELDAEMSTLPDRSPDDNFSAADHDKVLYGDSQ